jgi:hypothetical protein
LADNFSERVEFLDTIDWSVSRNYYFEYPLRWFMTVSIVIPYWVNSLASLHCKSLVSEIIAAAAAV